MAVMSQIARINPRCESFFAAMMTSTWLLAIFQECGVWSRQLFIPPTRADFAKPIWNGCGGSNRDRRRCAYTW